MARLALALTAAAALLAAAACAGQPTAPAARVPSAVTATAAPVDQPAAPKAVESVPTPTASPAGKPVATAAVTPLAATPTPVAARVTPAVAGAPPPGPTAAAAPTRPADTTASGAPKTTGAPTVKVEVVLRGLDTPWAIDFAPDGRWFVTERPGRVRVVENGQLQPEPWMSFEVWEREDSEAGLLGIALDPKFAENRFVYLAYTYPAGGRLQNRLVRLREDPGTKRGVEDRVLFDGVLGNQNHDGGRVKFGPDGKLYATMGDAAEAAHAQQRESLSGKILRINPDGSVPGDNPFPGSPVYSLGHRNPQGLAWDARGRLIEAEHGSSARDEINHVEPGRNYGWPEVRGQAGDRRFVDPIIESKEDTWAPSGIAILGGDLFVAALRGQRLLRMTLAPDLGGPTRVETVLRGYGRLRDVVVGPDRALYVTTSNRDGRGSPAADDDRILRVQP